VVRPLALVPLVLLHLGGRSRTLALGRTMGLALLTFARSWVTNFYSPESLLGVPRALLPTLGDRELLCSRVPVRGNGKSPKQASTVREAVLFSACQCAVGRVAVYEVSGRVFCGSGDFEGVALLAAGCIARERVLRLCGLALFLFCVLSCLFLRPQRIGHDQPDRSSIVLGLGAGGRRGFTRASAIRFRSTCEDHMNRRSFFVSRWHVWAARWSRVSARWIATSIFDSVRELWSDVLRDADGAGLQATRVSDAEEIPTRQSVCTKCNQLGADGCWLAALRGDRGTEGGAGPANRKGIPYQFLVIDEAVQNAFALPGGQRVHFIAGCWSF